MRRSLLAGIVDVIGLAVDGCAVALTCCFFVADDGEGALRDDDERRSRGSGERAKTPVCDTFGAPIKFTFALSCAAWGEDAAGRLSVLFRLLSLMDWKRFRRSVLEIVSG